MSAQDPDADPDVPWNPVGEMPVIGVRRPRSPPMVRAPRGGNGKMRPFRRIEPGDFINDIPVGVHAPYPGRRRPGIDEDTARAQLPVDDEGQVFDMPIQLGNASLQWNAAWTGPRTVKTDEKMHPKISSGNYKNMFLNLVKYESTRTVDEATISRLNMQYMDVDTALMLLILPYVRSRTPLDTDEIKQKKLNQAVYQIANVMITQSDIPEGDDELTDLYVTLLRPDAYGTVDYPVIKWVVETLRDRTLSMAMDNIVGVIYSGEYSNLTMPGRHSTALRDNLTTVVESFGHFPEKAEAEQSIQTVQWSRRSNYVYSLFGVIHEFFGNRTYVAENTRCQCVKIFVRYWMLEQENEGLLYLQYREMLLSEFRSIHRHQNPRNEDVRLDENAEIVADIEVEEQQQQINHDVHATTSSFYGYFRLHRWKVKIFQNNRFQQRQFIR